MRRRRAIGLLAGWVGVALLPGWGCSPPADSDIHATNSDGTPRESPEADEKARAETLEELKKSGKLGKTPKKSPKAAPKSLNPS